MEVTKSKSNFGRLPRFLYVCVQVSSLGSFMGRSRTLEFNGFESRPQRGGDFKP